MMMRKILGAGAALVLAVSSTLAIAETKTLTIGYVEGWSDSVATTFVASEVIKQKLGYDVKLQSVAAGIMWQAVATDKLDLMLSAWLPGTHGEYYAKYKDQVVNYGPNFKDAKIGLIVPEYVKAKTIEDLKTDASFNKKITGIDAGSGVMLKTDQAIKDYGLDGYKLQASSGAGMIAELTARKRRRSPSSSPAGCRTGCSPSGNCVSWTIRKVSTARLKPSTTWAAWGWRRKLLKSWPS